MAQVTYKSSLMVQCAWLKYHALNKLLIILAQVKQMAKLYVTQL